MSRNNIYNISATESFLDVLAEGIIRRYAAQDLNELSKILVLLPNKRSCTGLREAFLRQTKGKPVLLPKIRPVGDIDSEEIFITSEIFDIPEPVPAIKEKFILAKLIMEWQKENQGGDIKNYTEDQALFLAGELRSFLHDLQRENIPFTSLGNIVPDELAKHWQITMDFLYSLVEKWGYVQKKEGFISSVEFQKKLTKKQIELWRDNPPEYPVIIAGSTGSIPATSELIKEVLSLKKGAVILPALDTFCSSDYWKSIDKSHPQYAIKNLLSFLSVSREDVANWSDGCDDNERLRVASEVLSPPEVIKEWFDLSDKKGFEGISILEASDIQEEAEVISLAIREKLENKDCNIAVITHSRDISRRIISIMEKWGIKANDSAGIPISETSIGIFLRLIADVPAGKYDPITLLSLLKNPFTEIGESKFQCRKYARELEKKFLRGIRKYDNIDSLCEVILSKNETDLYKWLMELRNIINKFELLLSKEKVSLRELIENHIKCCENISVGDNKNNLLWSGHEGKFIYEFLNDVISYSDDFGVIDPKFYPAFFSNLLSSILYRPAYGFHPRVSILSPIEARLHRFDFTIFADLNEHSWPKKYAFSWMGDSMREKIGLTTSEEKQGLSAHDFYSHFCSPEILLCRSKKKMSETTVSSRWLLRLQALAEKLNIKNIKEDCFLAKAAKIIKIPSNFEYLKPPSPSPDIAFRPFSVSVTQVGKLVENPYEVYTKLILKLTNLREINEDPESAEFGSLVHKAIEIYLREYKDGTREEFLNAGRKAFSEYKNNHSILNIWQSRFEEIADYFVFYEKERRKNANKVFAEQEGKHEFSFNDGKLSIKTRVDRIEVSPSGNVCIADYKTGSLPSISDVKVGIAPQLSLESLIFEKGGFASIINLDKEQPKVDNLVYIKLFGNKKIEEKNIKNETVIKIAENGILKLINYFYNKQNPYYSYPYGRGNYFYDEYDHFSRYDEWAYNSQ